MVSRRWTMDRGINSDDWGVEDVAINGAIGPFFGVDKAAHV